MEYKLHIQEGKKPVKQSLARRFVPNVIEKIKEEIERLLETKFIHTTRYVDQMDP